MKMFLVMMSLAQATGPVVADERPFALGEEPSEIFTSGFPSGGRKPPERGIDDRGNRIQGAYAPRSEDRLQSVSRRTQWLMFTAECCPACRAARADFEPWLKRSGWRIDDSPEAHIRLIDGDAHPDFVVAMRIEMYPTFVLMRDGVELFRQQGYPGRNELVRRYSAGARSASEERLPNIPRSRFGLPPADAAERPHAAINVGTLHGQRENIAALIAAMRPLLSDGGTLTLQLDRRGEKTAEIPLSDRVSILAANPLVMRYTLVDDVLTCRFAEPLPRGRFTFGLPIEQPIAAVSASVSEVVVELPRAPDVTWRVSP